MDLSQVERSEIFVIALIYEDLESKFSLTSSMLKKNASLIFFGGNLLLYQYSLSTVNHVYYSL